MLNEQINKIHTPCKDCVFAKYQENTQVDCELNYISKYKTKNIEVLEAYDDEKEFYIINGKQCIGYRENKWFSSFDLKDNSVNGKVEKFNELNRLDYISVIDLKSISLDELESLLQQTNNVEIRPKKLIIIRYANNMGFPYEILREILDKYAKDYIWRIQTILDPLIGYDSILKNIVSLNYNRFIVSITKHNNDIKKIIEYTNQLVHHDLDQFNIISNSHKDCLIFSRCLYTFEVLNGKNLLDEDTNYTTI